MTFNQTPDRLVYFTSDFHYNHKLEAVWKSRGYASVEDHDLSLIQSVNAVVRPNDILFNLGDLTLNSSIKQFKELIFSIKCQNIYLLNGNHNNPHYKEIYLPLVKDFLGDKYVDGIEVYPLRYNNVIYIGHYAEVTVDKQRIVLSHYPISIWNLAQRGSIHLCGHSHGGSPRTNPNTSTEKILDVGFDCHNNKPWSFQEVMDLMNTKSYISIDHHK